MEDTLLWLIPVASALIGALAGGAASFWAQRSLSIRRDKDQRRALAAALAAELSSIHALIEFRAYRESLDLTIDDMTREGRPISWGFRARKEYFPVFKGNIDKIGLLPAELAQRVTSLYAAMNALLEDIEPIEEIEYVSVELALENRIETGELLQHVVRALPRTAEMLAKEARIGSITQAEVIPGRQYVETRYAAALNRMGGSRSDKML